jgi:hypothetical protein
VLSGDGRGGVPRRERGADASELVLLSELLPAGRVLRSEHGRLRVVDRWIVRYVHGHGAIHLHGESVPAGGLLRHLDWRVRGVGERELFRWDAGSASFDVHAEYVPARGVLRWGDGRVPGGVGQWRVRGRHSEPYGDLHAHQHLPSAGVLQWNHRRVLYCL